MAAGRRASQERSSHGLDSCSVWSLTWLEFTLSWMSASIIPFMAITPETWFRLREKALSKTASFVE